MSDTMKRMWTERQVRALGVDAVERKSDLKVFENIVDKDGHKRFIEGEVTFKTIAGVTGVYGKWSLSGTHLMIVIFGSVANGTTLTDGQTLADLVLPDWIHSKVTTLYGNNVDVKTIQLRGSSGDSQSMGTTLYKGTSKLEIVSLGLILSNDRNFRIQFDLLIDDE